MGHEGVTIPWSGSGTPGSTSSSLLAKAKAGDANVLLTFDVGDFTCYPGVAAADPQDI